MVIWKLITCNTLWSTPMNNKSDWSFINSHTKWDCCDNHGIFTVHPIILDFCSFTVFQTSMISLKTKNWWLELERSSTTSWGCWKHPFGIPGVRPMFLKPKLLKQSKNGFKTICCRCYPLMIFSKNCFSVQNNHQKIRCFVDFWIFMAIYIDLLDQF